MNAKVTLDSAGRLVLPKAMRDALRVGPGDTLDIEREEDRLILSPVRVRPGLLKEQGIWVYRSGPPASASIPELVNEQRLRRSRKIAGDPS